MSKFNVHVIVMLKPDYNIILVKLTCLQGRECIYGYSESFDMISFSKIVEVISFKLCMMITSIEHYIYIFLTNFNDIDQISR